MQSIWSCCLIGCSEKHGNGYVQNMGSAGIKNLKFVVLETDQNPGNVLKFRFFESLIVNYLKRKI